MEFKKYVRNPFVVEGVEITEENIEEVADLVGKIIPAEGAEPMYIALNRRLIPNVGRAYVGWWLTRLGDNFRAYAPKVFSDQFKEILEHTNVVSTNGTVNVFESEEQAAIEQQVLDNSV